jgi:hypothetical protein
MYHEKNLRDSFLVVATPNIPGGVAKKQGRFLVINRKNL